MIKDLQIISHRELMKLTTVGFDCNGWIYLSNPPRKYLRIVRELPGDFVIMKQIDPSKDIGIKDAYDPIISYTEGQPQ